MDGVGGRWGVREVTCSTAVGCRRAGPRGGGGGLRGDERVGRGRGAAGRLVDGDGLPGRGIAIRKVGLDVAGIGPGEQTRRTA